MYRYSTFKENTGLFVSQNTSFLKECKNHLTSHPGFIVEFYTGIFVTVTALSLHLLTWNSMICNSWNSVQGLDNDRKNEFLYLASSLDFGPPLGSSELDTTVLILLLLCAFWELCSQGGSKTKKDQKQGRTQPKTAQWKLQSSYIILNSADQ